MSTKEDQKDIFQRKQLKINELSINMEKLDRDYETILKESGLNFEQIKNYVDNPDNFSQPIWQRLHVEKQKLSLKLDLALENIKDPSKLKRTFSERGKIQSHWIFVR
jgi:hypothetical protein